MVRVEKRVKLKYIYNNQGDKMELMTVGIMMLISGTLSSATAQNMQHTKNDTSYEKSKEYKPKKKKKKVTIFGYEVKKVRPR
jgi:hypothetical protein